MTVLGQYVDTFTEASHALPEGMSMSADYPFMICRVVRIEAGRVFIRSETSGKEAYFTLRRRADGTEYGIYAQKSSYEAMFNKPATKFTFEPFKQHAGIPTK